MTDVKKSTHKKDITFWQKLQYFFTITDQDLKSWKKKNYETRRQIGHTSDKEDEEYNAEYDKKKQALLKNPFPHNVFAAKTPYC